MSVTHIERYECDLCGASIATDDGLRPTHWLVLQVARLKERQGTVDVCGSCQEQPIRALVEARDRALAREDEKHGRKHG